MFKHNTFLLFETNLSITIGVTKIKMTYYSSSVLNILLLFTGIIVHFHFSAVHRFQALSCTCQTRHIIAHSQTLESFQVIYWGKIHFIITNFSFIFKHCHNILFLQAKGLNFYLKSFSINNTALLYSTSS